MLPNGVYSMQMSEGSMTIAATKSAKLQGNSSNNSRDQRICIQNSVKLGMFTR